MRRWPAALALVLGLAAMTSAGIALADDTDSSSAPGIGGFTIYANAPGLQMIYDNTAGIGGTHPTGYGTVPEASASLETGSIAKGLASVVWPGPLLGNLGAS